MGKKPEDKTVNSASRTKSRLNPAARRALAEAEERRNAHKPDHSGGDKEVGGVDGPDPVRYGDWEKDGTISDF